MLKIVISFCTLQGLSFLGNCSLRIPAVSSTSLSFFVIKIMKCEQMFQADNPLVLSRGRIRPQISLIEFSALVPSV
jgi:hypothetical protein